MPSAEVHSTVTRQQEKPTHYAYLKSFRTEQCKDFLNHRCNQHRPFTCFHWHFPNQRRRRPVLNPKDGTFNYSPDIYCTNYDEATGVCSQGDSCPYLHRNIGDTEKRYHLRFYKTERCIIDTESKGSCTKNGPHCAFAHGADDLRASVYDINERNGSNTKPSDQQQVDQELINEREKEKMANIDPIWYDENYIKLYYKTEPCSRATRHVTLACPFYHNAKDRRRRHDLCKYRAVVCPSVKHKEEWMDPSECELADSCTYIHTRTEQQYHPDIYKTDKCYEEATNGRCSKGIFCAFAHENACLPPPPAASPARAGAVNVENCSAQSPQAKIITGTDLSPGAGRNKSPGVNGKVNAVGIGGPHVAVNGINSVGGGANSEVDSNWLSFNSLKLEPRSNEAELQSRIKLSFPPAGPTDLGQSFFDSRRQDYPHGLYGPQYPVPVSKSAAPGMSLNVYHPPGVNSTLESAFKASGSVLPSSSASDSHLMDRLDSLEDDDHALLGPPNSGATKPTQPPPTQSLLFNSTQMVGVSSEFGQYNPPPLGFRPSNPGFSYMMPGYAAANGGGLGTNQTSRLAMYGLTLQPSEVDKLRSELDEAKKVIKRLSEENQALIHHQRASAFSDQKVLSNGNYLRCLIPAANLEFLTVPYLQDLQVQLQLDVRRLQTVMSKKAGGKCLGCLDRTATTLLPCKHKSLCEPCLTIAKNCPLCSASIPDQQQF